ncbi:2-phospho-L-lactate guanylyltransferase [Streptomyces melanosporofaciens]|uniref:Phosphoenolpyruvate guanylyltransferase n=1 Tax=Streptomyces melanosporofaciens TaxID=67327 RepID=A0A1H4UDQ2_STRMJ|nr:2-phospho-L-lactate guanylyltransferase [Streptomyces melanosporofaciens]
MTWTLVVPLKPLSRAKTRLSDAAGDGLRASLALAFAQDTVGAALASRWVRGVTVVTDDPLAGRELSALGARILPDSPGRGLNAALAHGALAVRGERPGAAVAAMNADLPALRTVELDLVLDAASGFSRAFLADAAGVGTTLLTAAPGADLAPAFGGPSRARHRASGAREIELAGVDSVRRDVDTAGDLRAAVALGVGDHTRARLADMQGTAYTYDPETRAGSVLLDDGTPLPFDTAAFDAGGLRMLRPGQRVRIEVEGEGEQRRVVFVTLQTF